VTIGVITNATLLLMSDSTLNGSILQTTTSTDNQALEYLKLSLTPGLGARKIKMLSEHFGNAAKILSATNQELSEVAGVGPKLIQAINTHRDNDAAEKELKRASHLGIDIISIVDTRYPQSLRQIFDPPPVIYVLGSLPKQVLNSYEHLRSVGIVGTRDASDYGLDLRLEPRSHLSK